MKLLVFQMIVAQIAAKAQFGRSSHIVGSAGDATRRLRLAYQVNAGTRAAPDWRDAATVCTTVARSRSGSSTASMFACISPSPRTPSLADILEPAISYAEGGFPVLPRVASSILAAKEFFIEEWPSSAAVWLPAATAIGASGLLFGSKAR